MKAAYIPLLLTLLLPACGARQLTDDRVMPRHPLGRYHRIYRPGKPWQLTPDGVELRLGDLPRTKGLPLTTTTIWNDFGKSIDRWSKHYQVPAELIIATIAIEGQQNTAGYSRNPNAVRHEPGYVSNHDTPGRISVGLMQITLSTAQAVLNYEGQKSIKATESFVKTIDNNIRLGTAYIAYQARGKMSNRATLLDPPAVFAAYNAGGLYRMGGLQNTWKLKQYPHRSGKHVDRGVAFFNDAVAALQEHSIRPTYDYHDYLATLNDWR